MVFDGRSSGARRPVIPQKHPGEFERDTLNQVRLHLDRQVMQGLWRPILKYTTHGG